MSNIPVERPKMSRDEVLALIKTAHPDFVPPDFFIVGIRGYYKAMGKAGVNDRNIYDDALFLVGRDEFYPFNGNTDPAAFRLSIATLKAGIWPVYKFDIHGGSQSQYPAICQRGGPVTVLRDGGKEETGMFGINNHKGGINGTSSLGCQTVPVPQWKEYYATAVTLAKKYYGDAWNKKDDYNYVLLEI